MTTATTVLQVEERQRALWHRTYAPLRRAIAGTWVKKDEHARFEFRIDADGGFALNCYDSHTFLRGRYNVVAVDGSYWIAFDCSDGQKNAVRIEDVETSRLRLSWLDDPEHPFELVRRADATQAYRLSA